MRSERLASKLCGITIRSVDSIPNRYMQPSHFSIASPYRVDEYHAMNFLRFGRKLKLPSTRAIKYQLLIMMLRDELLLRTPASPS